MNTVTIRHRCGTVREFKAPERGGYVHMRRTTARNPQWYQPTFGRGETLTCGEGEPALRAAAWRWIRSLLDVPGSCPCGLVHELGD